MEKSNLGIVTDGITAVTQPQSEQTHIPSKTAGYLLQIKGLYCLFLKDTDYLHHDFHKFYTN